jgi:hypothetical protein
MDKRDGELDESRRRLAKALGAASRMLRSKRSRKPRRDEEGGEAVPAEPGRGPLPLEGGAEAPLD